MTLLDPKWKYTPSAETDIRKTFQKARKALAKGRQGNVRPAKLQLMPARSDAANSPATRPRSIPALYSPVSVAAEGLPNHESQDRPSLVSGRFDRHIGR